MARAVEGACWEVIPLEGVERKLGHLPAGATVAITCSPEQGIGATLELAARLTQQGVSVVPHVAARLVRDRAHLREIADRLGALGIPRLFAVAGDVEQPVGRYDGALPLLRDMAELDHAIAEVGVACYPEGHPLIAAGTLLDLLADKEPFAAYGVTQMCLDPEAIARWVTAARGRDIQLPIRVGVPGVASRAKLLQTAARIGVGKSIRFLRAHTRLVGELIRPGGFSPDELLGGLAPHLADPRLGLRGLHLFTFNQLEPTARWHASMLSRIEG
ncbi:MAG: methylenetetrahydrofolate reductase [Deltaproteobacteria bacterium]|nr:methylenetetrahydrofolate reductase [Deltaproteobacteria bacterium]MBW2532722.1 methylenetetrahydrofolate reductase [Deltaproteobacteria bacterium]